MIAFMGGMAGTITGITPAFIIYGFAGILLTVMGAADGFYNTYIMNLALMPCVCLAGGVAGTALAGRREKYHIHGMDTMKSLSHLNDLSIYFIGGLFGVLGFGMCYWFNRMNLPADTGAVSLVLSSIAIRLLVSNTGVVTCEPVTRSNWRTYIGKNRTSFLFFPALLSVITYWVVKETGNVMICFYISACSLVLLKFDPDFPATHHVTLIAAYAASVFDNLLITLVFGLIAQFVFIVAGLVINYGEIQEGDKGHMTQQPTSHIDPPTVSIALISLMVFMVSFF